MRTYSKTLKTISFICLAFFTWTYLPLSSAVAFAATKSQGSTKGQKAESSRQARQKTTEEKFQESLDRIREAGTDRAKLKAERSAIDQLDTELQKQFKDVEVKIKNLPDVIKQRHRDFTKKYAANMNTLKSHLSAIEQAKSDDEIKAATEKAKAFLQSVRPPSRHQKIDPQNLPFRARKVTKTVAPRLKKEDFERDFLKQKSQSKRKLADGRLLPDLLTSRVQQKPVLLAFNETTSDIPFSLGFDSSIPHSALRIPHWDIPQSQIAFSDSSSFLLAQQTADLPTPEDLSENGIEIQFTPEIRAKAHDELGCNPVKLYEFVRNSIEFVPTYGSIQGAQMTLETKMGNSFDTSSLLISLFRSCNIPARYSHNTAEIDISRVMNWVGNFTDPRAAVTFIASGGIPIKPYASGGVITKVQMEEVSVEAYVPYGPYSGRPSNLNADKIWVPLSPSFKQFTYTAGLDLQSVVPFDGQAFVNQVQSTATINETEGYVTNVDSNYIQTTLTDYQTQIKNYISQNKPNATVGDIIGKKEIKKQELGILPVTLPYKTITTGVKYSEIPDSLRHKVSFEIQDDSISGNSLSYTVSIPEIAGKRVTLSYGPATASDEQVINNYGGIFNVPAYLVNMKPQIKIEGVTMASGSGIGLGNQQTFNMQFISPSIGIDVVSNNVTAGAYYGIGVIPNNISKEVLQKRLAKVQNIGSAACSNNINTDDCVGELLYSTVLAYFFDIYAFDDASKQKFKIADIHHVSEGIVSKNINATYFWNVPLKVSEASMMIDVDRVIHSSVSKTGDLSKEHLFMILSGQTSSVMENGIFEQLYRAKGASTIKLLETANNQKIPIYTITQQNIAAVLPRLAVPSNVIADIENAINVGKNVIIPQQNVNYYGWTGVGYIIMDQETGSGAYMISSNSENGGLCIAAGGCTTTTFDGSIFIDAFTALAIVAFLEPIMLLVEYAMAELLLLGPIGWATFAFFVVLIALILIVAYIAVTELQSAHQQN